MRNVAVVGGGFAGTECACYLADRGVSVTLYEMKPVRFSPAHRSEALCELVCSNSFKASRVGSAAGLLKAEMRLLGSVTVETALGCSVPAGGALAVDRAAFSRGVTEQVLSRANIRLVREEIAEIPTGFDAVVIAAGPLASDALTRTLRERVGDAFLSFYDAAAPVVEASSVDMAHAFCQSRYDRGGEDDYVNCPMDKAQYEAFYEALVTAETAALHDFDKGAVYEGCMPVEVLAKRGHDAIRYGPLKPVGLVDPRTGHRPWANVQLRRENAAGTMYNLVGFQTNLKFSEQKRVFGMIPALAEAEYVRYGVMHRNTFLNAPRVLEPDQSLKGCPSLFFAGQITGVEGYMESASSGITAAIHVLRYLAGKQRYVFPAETMLGGLQRHLSDTVSRGYQPMGAAFGLLPPSEDAQNGKRGRKNKKERYEELAKRSLSLYETTVLPEINNG